MPESFLPWAEKWCYCHTYTEMWDMLTQNVCGEGANRKSVLRLQSSAMQTGTGICAIEKLASSIFRVEEMPITPQGFMPEDHNHNFVAMRI